MFELWAGHLSLLSLPTDCHCLGKLQFVMMTPSSLLFVHPSLFKHLWFDVTLAEENKCYDALPFVFIKDIIILFFTVINSFANDRPLLKLLLSSPHLVNLRVFSSLANRSAQAGMWYRKGKVSFHWLINHSSVWEGRDWDSKTLTALPPAALR